MKIGIVSKYPPEEDGIGIYTVGLCSELDNLGIDVVKIGDKASSTANYAVDFRSFSLGSRLKRIVETEKLDLLHIQYIASYFGKLTLNLNLILALSQKVPVVVTFHEVHTKTATIRQKVLAFLQKAIAKKASAVMAHTIKQKEFLQMMYKKKGTYAIRMGLVPKPMHQLKGKNLLFFGMLNYGKGVEYLIDAMNELPGFHLTVAGKAISQDYESIVRSAAGRNRLGNVKLDIRWIPEDVKQNLMEAADIMVFPYVWAPYQSAAMHDAFSYGIPVVVTDTGAIGEVVKEFRCGVVVEQRSPKALVEGIKKVYGSYDIYQHGVTNYREEANWEKVARKHAEMYNLVLQEHYDEHGILEQEKTEKNKQAQELANEDVDEQK